MQSGVECGTKQDKGEALKDLSLVFRRTAMRCWVTYAGDVLGTLRTKGFR
jgi:hypothetical protein